MLASDDSFTTGTDGSPAADLSLEVLGPLVERIEQQAGPVTLAEVARAAGIDEGALRQASGRATVAQVGVVLERAQAIFASEAELRHAIGPRPDGFRMSWLARWSRTVGAGYRRACASAARSVPLGELRVSREGPGHLVVRWQPAANLPALLCTLGMAWLEALPVRWGLPRAAAFERRCVHRGDDRCEYDIRHHVHPTLFGALVGSAAGAAAAATASAFGGAGAAVVVLLVMLGAVLGLAFELARVRRVNVRISLDAQRAARARARDQAHAEREQAALEERQRDWTRLLEQELGARTEALERITDQIATLQRKRKAKLQGFSHDVRNPLAAIRMTAEFLQEQLQDGSEPVRRALEDLQTTTRRMEELLGQLLRTAASDSSIALRAPTLVAVPSLARTLEGRLRALVHGRSITTDVVVTEAAPGNLRVDPLRFDRVLDNLITNAAKYTERGSITISLDGSPGLLIVRVADSGRGMSERLLRQLFFERELTAAKTSGSGGWGLGLAVVVRLLAELGGELHVESVEGRGSTFEVRLPVAPPAAAPAADGDRAEEATAPQRSRQKGDRPAARATGADSRPANEPFDTACRRVVRLRPRPATTQDS